MAHYQYSPNNSRLNVNTSHKRWQPIWSQIPPHIVTLSDYEQAALQYLPDNMLALLFENNIAFPATLESVETSSKQQPTGHDGNAQALDSLKWLPRVLTPEPIDLSCHLYNPNAAVPLDLHLPHPLWLSPVAHQGFYHPDAERATLQAANILQTSCIFSSMGNTPFETLLPNTQMSNAVQWYWQPIDDASRQFQGVESNIEARREYNLHLINALIQKGMNLLVITVDAPHSGVRSVSRRMGAYLPEYCQAVNLPVSSQQNTATDLHRLLAQAPTWADIEWLVARCQVPVLLKGILHPEDAKQAQAIGCAGIIASNHGRRVISDVMPVAACLPSLRETVGDEMVILADGGVRSGSDIAKLIHLGADAVGIGRGYIYGLALAGALGVAHTNKLLLEELQVTMATLGVGRLEALKSVILKAL